MTVWERLFDASGAFDHPFTLAATVAVVLALVVATLLVRVLGARRVVSAKTHQELLARTRSWYVLAAAMIVPILLGAAWVWFFFLLLSLFCLREFARVTGLVQSRSVMAAVAASIMITFFAALDHWMGLFTASWPLGMCLIAVIALAADQPQGYLQRVSLAVVGFALVGSSLGHLAYIGNDPLFRPILLWLLLCVELNDIFAYLCGKSFGKRKLAPNTSPNKTWGGAVGAIVCTTLLAGALGHYVFQGTTLDKLPHLLAMGAAISILGQCGDLLISSIKRDVGVKDMAASIPGHGGLLDRFDSLLLAAPVLFHYINYFKANGIAGSEPARILTSGW